MVATTVTMALMKTSFFVVRLSFFTFDEYDATLNELAFRICLKTDFFFIGSNLTPFDPPSP
jgi:hypothetical protein